MVIRQIRISGYAQLPKRRTILTMTGRIAAGTNFSVTSSGVSYTKTGDDGDLQISDALFQSVDSVMVFCNGAYQRKGTDVVWISRWSFQLGIIQDIGDEIIVLS